MLNRLISTDDGARRLGEVALVPHSSPIAQSGVLFWNTLFDENAASHIALGPGLLDVHRPRRKDGCGAVGSAGCQRQPDSRGLDDWVWRDGC